MPMLVEWSKQERSAHDSHLRKAAQHSQNAIKAAQAIVDNVAEMQKHALAIGAAALGREAPRPVSNRDLVGMLNNMNKVAWAIVRSRPRKLTRAQLKRHHQHLNANIPEYAKNASAARIMAGHWTAVTRHLRAIAVMYSKI